jgi:D-sedoheptulose 7-phosphate isomerase
MQTLAQSFFHDLAGSLEGCRSLIRGQKPCSLAEGVAFAGDLVLELPSENHMYFIGNGASAAIASHMAADFCKSVRRKALCFNDGALLTCLGNDLGYPDVFAFPTDLFGRKGDILFAISSSGTSPNILKAVEIATNKGLVIITLSGFSSGNPLSQMGLVNFHVPNQSYGPVEIIHHAICHCILDVVKFHSQRKSQE